ncbi:hypothetical protein VUR80DRAFT_9225 [Thermomyces stellatus]
MLILKPTPEPATDHPPAWASRMRGKHSSVKEPGPRPMSKVLLCASLYNPGPGYASCCWMAGNGCVFTQRMSAVTVSAGIPDQSVNVPSVLSTAECRTRFRSLRGCFTHGIRGALLRHGRRELSPSSGKSKRPCCTPNRPYRQYIAAHLTRS